MTTVTHGSITASIVAGNVALGTVHKGGLLGPNGVEIQRADVDDAIACLQDLREEVVSYGKRTGSSIPHLDLIGDLFHRLCKENERCKDADPELAIGVRWAIRQIQSYCQTIGVDPHTLGKRAIAEIKAKDKREEANALRCRAVVLETEV